MRTILMTLLATLAFASMSCSNENASAPPAAAIETSAAEAPAAAEPESSIPSIDACAVLTRDEIEPVFGTLKEGPTADSGLSKEKLCKYSNMDGSWLQTSLYGSDRWGLQKGTYSEMDPKPMPGLGDEAFSVKRGTDSLVFVRKGGGVVEISCSCDRVKAETLAAKAATKI